MDLKRQITNYRLIVGSALAVLERQLLVFPLSVVLLASVTFIFGGACAAWQWWSAIVASISVGCVGRRWQAAVCGSGLFLLSFVLLYGVVFISVDLLNSDVVACHLPATHMLINGWNPIVCSTPEAIKATLGIEPWDMRLFHVLTTLRSVWIFDAVAFFFHGDALSVQMPAMYFAFMALIVVVWRIFPEWGIWVRVLMLFLLWEYVFNPYGSIDTVVGLSGLGLLIVMAVDYKNATFHFLRLFSFSFWLVAAKPAGFSALFAFWLVFLLAQAIRHGASRKVILQKGMWLLLAVVAVFAMVSLTPYYTSYRDYGHPLYPAKTVDPVKYPTHDLIGDFKVLNEDAKSMGAVGLFMNAYVSPELTRWCYNMSQGREDFTPESFLWRRETGDARCPTKFGQRRWIWVLFALLLFVPCFKLTAVQVLLGLALFPPICYGYMRYFTWSNGLWVFPICWLCWRMFRSRPWMRFVFAALVICIVGARLVKVPLQFAIRIDEKLSLCKSRPKCIYSNRYTSEWAKEIAKNPASLTYTSAEDPSRSLINIVKYWSLHLKNLSGVPIEPLPLEKLDDSYIRSPLWYYVRGKDEIAELEINKSEFQGGLGQKIKYLDNAYFTMSSDLWCRLHLGRL